MRCFYKCFKYALILMLYLNSKVFANISSDSLHIVELFQNARIFPEQTDSLMEKAKRIAQTNPRLQEIFDFNQARQFILAGNQKSAQKLIAEKIKKLET